MAIIVACSSLAGVLSIYELWAMVRVIITIVGIDFSVDFMFELVDIVGQIRASVTIEGVGDTNRSIVASCAD